MKKEKSREGPSVPQLLTEKGEFSVGQEEKESCCSKVKTSWKKKEMNEKLKKKKKTEQKIWRNNKIFCQLQRELGVWLSSIKSVSPEDK